MCFSADPTYFTIFPISGLRENEQDLTSHIIYLNGIYKFKDIDKFQPYVGLGIAYLTSIKINFMYNDFEQSGLLGPKGLLGVNYVISKKIKLNFEADLSLFNDIELEEERYNSNSKLSNLTYNPLGINLGMVYSF